MFDELVQCVCSSDVQTQLSGLGYTRLLIQSGKTELPDIPESGLDVSWYSYKPSLSEDIQAADLVISHAGAGTCMEVLEAGKPLVVIVNDNLMDNHQIELAERLALDKHLVFGTVETLSPTIDKFAEEKKNLVPYRKPDGAIF